MDSLSPYAVAVVALIVALFAARRRADGNGWTYATTQAEKRVEDAEHEARAWMAYAWRLADMLRAACPECSLPMPPVNGHAAKKAEATPLTTAQRTKLREILSERFNLDELRDIAFDVGFADEGHETPASLARHLIRHVDARKQVDYLIARLKVKRPDIEL